MKRQFSGHLNLINSWGEQKQDYALVEYSIDDSFSQLAFAPLTEDILESDRKLKPRQSSLN
jgi:hypothetical protein